MFFRPSTPTSPTCLFDTQIIPDIRRHDKMRAFHTQTLSNNWEWKQRPETGDVDTVLTENVGWISTSVPTEIFNDLLDAKKIPDPHIGQHEKMVQWVGEVDWLYRARFTASHVPESNEKAVLAFDGLDTFALVYLNGKLILQTENMFHEHRVDVTSHLRSGSNDLGIVFESALRKGREEISKRGDLMCWNGEPSRLYVRKAQYHWGWDWGSPDLCKWLIVGPVMMSAGPWRPIRLEIYQSRIEEIHFPVNVSDDLSSATIDYSIAIESPVKDASVRLTLYPPHDNTPVYTETRAAQRTVTGTFTIKTPKLWYPVSYGPQPLYKIVIDLQETNILIDQKSQSLGIRRARVIQSPLDSEKGTTFYFEINNIPIFCGGSNWIPADNILTRLTPERYREWLTLLVKGNQNMIRVWGGGIYEDDSFYSTADELGILIWQDFLFACGQYPCHLEFRENVEREAKTQVKRLRHHPSIVLFAGNNEDYQIAESVSLDWDPNDTSPESWLQTNFPARFLYEKLLPDVVSKYAPGVFYHPGSPWGAGKPTADKTVGDIHQWNVWHGSQEPYQSYPKLGGRFISEFGMQALPSHRTISHFITSKRELYPQSETMDHHNKATGFERRLGAYILENFRLQDFSLKEYGEQSQRMQADALSTAYRGWRRLWCGPGKEFISGALVWQLNDCWPCTSWAVADFFLRPKMAWYAIARELRPITFCIERSVKLKENVLSEPPSGDGSEEEKLGKEKEAHSTPQANDEKTVALDVWGVNARLEEYEIPIKLQFFEISSGKVVYEKGLKAHIYPNQSTEIISKMDITKYNPANLVASVVFTLPSGETLRSSADWPQPLKYLDFHDREVSVSVDGETVNLQTHKPVKGVILDVEGDDDSGLEWNDNGFDLMPGENVYVTAKGLQGRKVSVSWYG